MKYIQITNQTHPDVKPILAKYCHSFICQLRGLMFTKSLAEQQGILLVQSSDSRINSSIHMMFMWMDLAVVWITGEFTVVDVILAKRWKIAYLPKQPAKYVLETDISHLKDFTVGDKVLFNEMS